MVNKNKKNIQDNSSLPDEIIYADDCDFLTRNHVVKKYINETVEKVLKKVNLIVNTSKTENTTLEIYPGKKEHEKEEWRKVKKLGSLLGDRNDIARRKQLASSSMKNVKKLWVGKKVSTKKKLILYNSLVKSILCYNSSTWGLSKKDEDSLNSFHRQQLTQILNIKIQKL